jgi:beta-lactamase regulating signal transducer with metallopeptidase domain
MEQVAFRLTMTLMHSIWQMAALLFIYFALTFIFRPVHPRIKRNILYFILLSQMVASVVTWLALSPAGIPLLSEWMQHTFSSGNSILALVQTYATLLCTLYLAGITLKTTLYTRQWYLLRSGKGKSWAKPPAEIRVFTEMSALRFGIKRKVQVWFTAACHSPVTYGFFKPVILLPITLMNQLTTEEAEALIIHELTHIRNHDYLLNWFLLTAETLYCFNPLVYIIGQQIRMEREKNCDMQVITFNYPDFVYAEALLKTAYSLNRLPSVQLAAVKKRSQLLTRIQYFSAPPAFRSAGICNFLVCLLVIACVSLNSVFLAGKQNPVAVHQDGVLPAFAIITPGSIKGYEPGQDQIRAVPPADKKDEETPAAVKSVAYISKQQEAPEKATEPLLPAGYTPLQAGLAESVPAKELIIEQENNEGVKTSVAYRVEFKQGQWVKEPIWIAVDIRKLKDSMRIALDSLHMLTDSIQ